MAHPEKSKETLNNTNNNNNNNNLIPIPKLASRINEPTRNNLIRTIAYDPNSV